MPSIILTRTAEECARTAPVFERHGFRVYAAPMVELRPLAEDACGIRSVRRLAGEGPVLLTSAFATELWLDMRETRFHDAVPSEYWVVGRRSADLLREGDPDVPVRAVASSAEELLREPFEGVERILYPCSTERRDTMVEGLAARGVQVVELPLYAPMLPSGARESMHRALVEAESPLVLAFFSPSAVKNFYGMNLVSEAPPGTILSAIGMVTAEELSRFGARDVIVSDHPDAESLARTLISAVQ